MSSKASTECACKTALARSFASVEDAVFGPLKTEIIAGSDELARAPNKWMSVYRCRACGAHWVEAYASSGHMDIDHLYPLPAAGVTDPERWLEDHGESLRFRRWL